MTLKEFFKNFIKGLVKNNPDLKKIQIEDEDVIVSEITDKIISDLDSLELVGWNEEMNPKFENDPEVLGREKILEHYQDIFRPDGSRPSKDRIEKNTLSIVKTYLKTIGVRP